MGFLPINTTKGERIFIGVILTFVACLLWLRFIEPLYPLSVWLALVVGGVIGSITYKYG
ncbi:MAG: DUF2160 family membrane protein [Nitrososphaerota archaeon]